MPRKGARAPKELVEQLGFAIRKMGAQSVLVSETIAGRFGIHKTDLESLDLIYLRGGACSAGELSRATGLTSGSTTALIDRLVKAGYVKREDDPNDRRRQIIRILPEAIEPIKIAYGPMQVAMFELWSSYRREHLEVIVDFISRSAELQAECLERMRADPSAERSKPVKKAKNKRAER